jgi:o-succinylbenzoate---CoA ligase
VSILRGDAFEDECEPMPVGLPCSQQWAQSHSLWAMEVDAWLVRAASRRPDRAALETPRGDWSYARLHAAARFGAGVLAARGARRGERVAIALPAGLDFAQALHACLLLGAVAVPVDLRLAAHERALISDGAAVVVDEPLGEGPEPDGLSIAGTHELDDVAVVIHTSGTTAAPRPVELTYANLLWSALGSGVALGVDEDERWLCALTTAHVGGLSILVRSAIYATTAVVHERFEVDRVLHELGARRTTLVSLVATTLARLLDAGLRRPAFAARSPAVARCRRRSWPAPATPASPWASPMD